MSLPNSNPLGRKLKGILQSYFWISVCIHIYSMHLYLLIYISQYLYVILFFYLSLFKYELKIHILILTLLLSHLSRVWLCATPERAAHQASPFLGFSRQEHWSGLPFPSSMHEDEKWKWNPLSHVWLFATPWNAAYQAPPSMGFSRQEYWSGGTIAFSALC